MKQNDKDAFTGSLFDLGTGVTLKDFVKDNKKAYDKVTAVVKYDFSDQASVSKTFTINLKSIFEDATVKYYKDEVETAIAPLTLNTTDNKYYIASVVPSGNIKKYTGIALKFENETDWQDYGWAPEVAGLTITWQSPLNKPSTGIYYTARIKDCGFEVKDSPIAFQAEGVQIIPAEGVTPEKGQSGILELEYMDANGIVYTFDIPFKY